MKFRAFMILSFLLFFPLVGFAKYCPACLRTYQAQTVRGQAHLVSQWIMQTLGGKKPLKLSDTKHLFSSSAPITINGKRVAVGARGIYRYMKNLYHSQKQLEARVHQTLVDGKYVTLRYEFVVLRKNKKYRTLAISILRFRHHKVRSWWEVSYRHQVS